MQIRDRKKNRPKNPSKIWFGDVLGSIWEGLGEVLGGVWRLLGLFGLFWRLFFSCLYLEWSSKVLLEPSGLDFGSILMDFGRILGSFGRVLGEGLGGICEHSGWFWAFVDYSGLLGCFGQIFARFWLVLLVAMEFILNSSSSWLYCLFLLSFACFGLLGLALACFGCLGCLP